MLRPASVRLTYRLPPQWGSVKFHRKSLQNLGKAMLETKRLCAVMLDTLGREVFVRRDVEVDEAGWPKHGDEIEVPMGGHVTLSVDPNAKQTNTVFPVNYDSLPGARPCRCGTAATARHQAAFRVAGHGLWTCSGRCAARSAAQNRGLRTCSTEAFALAALL